MSEASTESVSDEIRLLFGPAVSDGEIMRAVHDALVDLRGSVSAESLPEMAMKLAVVRLERAGQLGPAAGTVPSAYRWEGPAG